MTLNEEELLFCVRGALDFIDSFEPLYSLPVSTQRLAEKLGAVPCPFSFLIKGGIMPAKLVSCFGTRDGIAMLDNGVRRIFYNDAMPLNRIRFTLCEELMHHHLGHTQNPAFDPMAQSYTDEEYERCEQQARCGACLVLCPPALYFRNTLELRQIMRTCGVSESCALNIRRFYEQNGDLIRRELAGRRQLNAYYTVR